MACIDMKKTMLHEISSTKILQNKIIADYGMHKTLECTNNHENNY